MLAPAELDAATSMLPSALKSSSTMLRGFDVADTSVVPPLLWELDLGGCIESTSAVWDGRIFVGTWSGYIYGIGDPQSR